MITVPLQLVTSTDMESADRSDLDAQPGVVARTVYRTSYCLSFGIMLPTLLVASLLPRKNVAVCGIVAGAKAASGAQQRVRARATAAACATGQKVGNAYAGVATRVSQRMESLEDAIAERRYRRRMAASFV